MHRLSNNDSQNFEDDSTFDDERQSKLPQKLISNSGTFTNVLKNVHTIALARGRFINDVTQERGVSHIAIKKLLGRGV